MWIQFIFLFVIVVALVFAIRHAYHVLTGKSSCCGDASNCADCPIYGSSNSDKESK